MEDLIKEMNLKVYEKYLYNKFVIVLNHCILKKINHSVIDVHVKKFVPYSGECEYQLDYRSKDKVKPWGVATFYHPLLIKNHKKMKDLEKNGHKI